MSSGCICNCKCCQQHRSLHEEASRKLRYAEKSLTEVRYYISPWVTEWEPARMVSNIAYQGLQDIARIYADTPPFTEKPDDTKT